MEISILIRPAQKSDSWAWERMRETLWPSDASEHAGEIALFFNRKRERLLEVLIACDEAGVAIGFAELSIRPYAEECYSGRVAFLEGWFVEATARRRGVGAALVKAAEEWGREQACTEFASDTTIENEASAAAHRALGFSETGRIICFRKPL